MSHFTTKWHAMARYKGSIICLGGHNYIPMPRFSAGHCTTREVMQMLQGIEVCCSTNRTQSQSLQHPAAIYLLSEPVSLVRYRLVKRLLLQSCELQTLFHDYLVHETRLRFSQTDFPSHQAALYD